MKGGFTLFRENGRRFVKNNWFKLLLVLLALYIFFQKDLSFQVHFRSPGHPDVEEQDPPQVDRAARREKLTERRDAGKQPSRTGRKQLFDLSSAFKPGKKDVSYKELLEAVSEEARVAYLKRFAKVALVEQQKYGIPASIILANGLLHSVSGKGDWAVTGNNHFSLRCTDTWTGASGYYNGACLRHYESAWASYRDHSIFLSKDCREMLPFGQNAGYENWAEALARGPYSQESGLSAALVDLIGAYRLFELDELP